MKTLATLALSAFMSISVFAQTVTNLNNAGAGSLRNVVLNSQPGDVIDFAPSLFANGNATLNLDYPIPIVHSLTINGHLSNGDTLIINGQDSTQAFYVDGLSSSNSIRLKISDLVIEQCKQFSSSPFTYTTNGGAIMAYSIELLELENVHLRDNRVTGNARAGALYARDVDTVILTTSSFVRNRTASQTPTSSGGWGGAIRSANSSLFINGSTFRENQCADKGGAIMTFNAPVIRILNSEFIGNLAGLDSSAARTMDGGALCLSNANDYLIHNCQFINNRAEWSAGAIQIAVVSSIPNDTSRIEDCLFSLNSAGRHGGALYTSGADLRLVNSSFDRNEAGIRGGGLNAISSQVRVIKSTFVDNSANEGSALSVITNTECDVLNATITSSMNTAELIYRTNQGADSLTVKSSICHAPQSTGLFAGSGNIGSKGHNIFSSTVPFSLPTDQTGVSVASLDLGPLQMNGGLTPTMLPGSLSVALNAGNPSDFSPAQNGPIFGRRDIGAAERGVISYDTTLVCGNLTWWGNNYNMPGTYSDTAYNANSIDSVGVLVLYSQDTSIVNRNGTLVALEQSQGTSYQWVDCGNGFSPVTGATDSTFLPTVNGNYAVVLTNGSCSDTSDCINYNEVGIEEQSTTPLLTFYPNPTSGSITVNSADNLPQQLQVLDLSGRTISTIKVSNHEIQLPALSKGIYLMKWEFEGGVVQVDRVVVE